MEMSIIQKYVTVKRDGVGHEGPSAVTVKYYLRIRFRRCSLSNSRQIIQINAMTMTQF